MEGDIESARGQFVAARVKDPHFDVLRVRQRDCGAVNRHRVIAVHHGGRAAFVDLLPGAREQFVVRVVHGELHVVEWDRAIAFGNGMRVDLHLGVEQTYDDRIWRQR